MVTGGGAGYSAPFFTANQFGVSTPQVVSIPVSGYWFDNGTSWTVTNPLGGSTISERWFSSHTANGKISGAQTLAFSYSHQYYLTIEVNPSDSGNTSPSGFFDYGAEIQISATANAGYAFKNWTGSGAGSFTGTSSSALVTVNAAIVENAFFITQPMVMITVTCNPPGPGFLIVDGTPIVCPQTFAWVPGSTHTIEALKPSGNLWIQYVWQSWNDSGPQSHTITVPSSSTTFMATFQTTYPIADLIKEFFLNQIIAPIIVSVIVAFILGNYARGRLRNRRTRKKKAHKVDARPTPMKSLWTMRASPRWSSAWRSSAVS